MEEEIETYSVEVKCFNCGWEGLVEIPKTTPVDEFPCPNCEVEALKRKGTKETE